VVLHNNGNNNNKNSNTIKPLLGASRTPKAAAILKQEASIEASGRLANTNATLKQGFDRSFWAPREHQRQQQSSNKKLLSTQAAAAAAKVGPTSRLA